MKDRLCISIGVAACCLPIFLAAARGQDQAGTFQGQPASVFIEQLDPKNNPDINVRRRAAYALGQIEPPPVEALDGLRAALSDPQMETRWYAADALGHFGAAAAPAVGDIIKSLRSTVNDATVRQRGARSLGRIGPPANEAADVLEEALASDDALYRAEAALALWRIGRHRRAIPTLIDLLKTGNADAAFAAAMALADTGDGSTATINALIGALGNENADVRQAATFALAQIGAPAIEPLSAALRPSSDVSQRDAATALGMILEAVRHRVLYRDQTSERQFAAAGEPIVRIALPALARKLGDDDDNVRDAASLAMSKAASVAIPELLRALQSSNSTTNAAAAAALVRSESHLPRQRPLPKNMAAVHQRVLNDLINVLAIDRPEVRRAAVRLFVALEIGPEGKAAQPHLRAALDANDLATRRNADKALKRLTRED